MRTIEKELKEDESLIYRCGLHWAIFTGPGMVIMLAGLSIPSKGLSALGILMVGLLWGVFSTISFQRSWLCITDKRVLINVGFPLKRFYEIPLLSIQNVDTYQPSLGAILNFGKVLIVKDRKVYSFRLVQAPVEFKERVIRQVILARQECEERSFS